MPTGWRLNQTSLLLEEIVDVEVDHVFTKVRYRRSLAAGYDYPREVTYKISIGGKEKILRLRKTAHMEKDIPMYSTSTDKKLHLHQISEQTYATYQDPDVGASILLQCRDTEPSCDLYGGFYHEEEHYRIQPQSTGNKQHRISKTTRRRVVYRNTMQDDEIVFAHDVLVKRAVTNGGNNHVVELLLFLDDSVYDFFLNLSDGDEQAALNKMRMYYTLTANDMDLRYQSLSVRHENFRVNIMVNGFVFSKTLGGFPWISEHLEGTNGNVFDAESAMKTFGLYQDSIRDTLPGFDHAMQFSRRDLAFYEHGWQTDLLGVAYKGTTCSKPVMAVSIIEDSAYGTTGQTAAHELGHSLGSSHDGALGCNDDKQYIMASFVGPSTKRLSRHLWKMSACSSDAIYNYLNSMGRRVCTKKNSFRKDDFDEDHSLPSGGELYNLDTQCRLRQGKTSFACKPPSASICTEGIYCKIDDKDYCELTIAMEGSECGRRRKCDEGRCIRHVDKLQAAPGLKTRSVLLENTINNASGQRQIAIRGSRSM